jgi:hypothetical protein
MWYRRRSVSFHNFNRRATAVNLHIRGLAGVLLVLALLGVTGCSQDNETEVQQLSKGMGDPGARNPNEKKVEPRDASPDRAERFKNRPDPKKVIMGPNYPKN